MIANPSPGSPAPVLPNVGIETVYTQPALPPAPKPVAAVVAGKTATSYTDLVWAELERLEKLGVSESGGWG
jgi:hypothetical protein